jgi:Fe-S-cluster-containing dehydrogenase component
VFAQASVLQLWDPDRSQVFRRGESIGTHEAFVSELTAKIIALDAGHGEGLRILTRYVDSPTLNDQLRRMLESYPRARRHQWEPLHRDRSLAGARLAFGRPLDPVYRFDAADVILALDADFLGTGPGHLRYAREFASRRRASAARSDMNRLYAAESTTTLTGAMADHRLAFAPVALQRWLAQLAAEVMNEGAGARAAEPFVRALAADLFRHRGRALVVPGESLPPEAHALVHALNERLGAVGNTVRYVEPVAAGESCTESLRVLADDMRAGRVDTLVILGGNPAYDTPADFEFAQALKRVPFSLHLSLYHDETSALATWHVPQAHYLEHWSDARGHDGTASIVQPLIAPLYGGVSPHELLSVLLREPAAAGYAAVRRYWSQRARARDFEEFWRSALHDGVVPGSASAPVAARARPAAFSPPPIAQGWSVQFRDDPSVRDGEFANNAWLQELPRSDSKLTWDNAALVSPASARVLAAETGDIVDIAAGARKIRAPLWVLPGQVDETITLALGYGRARAGTVGNGVGFDAYRLRTAGTPWTIAGVDVRKAGAHHAFATTQSHARMEGREPVRRATLAELLEGAKMRDEAPAGSLYPKWDYEGYRWGMAIDLSACIGCNACTIACQAENNIPTVGKEEVARGREMHWIRVDRYYEGEAGRPRMFFQPVPCMHCETAPCEEVCPVGATLHDSEGINVQVYNRCVGTRFCSNNCPYKVRRFNFLQYSDEKTESLKAARNPEVTVRMRGVMEKCNYCLQRVTRARIETEKEGRRIRDGEVMTACQAVCPTEAIVFGDLNDPQSRVVAAKRSPLDYALLGELNTRPRTTYGARLLNPNPEIAES